MGQSIDESDYVIVKSFLETSIKKDAKSFIEDINTTDDLQELINKSYLNY